MGGLRVIVGEENGPRSTLWRIFAGSRTSDVYVGARPIVGEVKVSLHERGPWRFGFTKQHQQGRNPFIAPEQDRARYKWTRPPEFAPGLTRAFIIVVASSELRQRPGPDPLRKPAVWVPPPPDGSQVEINLFFARNRKPSSWPGQRSMATDLLYEQPLPNGEDLVVVSHVVPTAQEVRARLEHYRQAITSAQRQALAARVNDASDLRGVLFAVPGPNPPPDLAGVCAFYDVLIPRP